MQVPFLDLKAQYTSIKDDVDQAVLTVMNNCNFILGREVEEFETQFAHFLNVEHAIGVSSGLDALRLALEALRIGAGDEVIIPANTFIATALAVSGVGARPVLVDIEAHSYNIDLNLIEAAITSQTKAIMPVHLYGQPCNIEELINLARKYNLYVVEDTAQSHGAHYRGKSAGTLGDAGCFSFYPGKNLGAYGDGGAVVTNDAAIATRLRQLRNYGQEKKYYHVEKGTNSRLDTIQAAILNVKLKHLADWNRRRAANAALYNELLLGIEQVTVPQILPDRDHVFHLYVVRVKERERLQQYLSERGISTIIHYPIPIHMQEAYKDLAYAEGSFPVTEKAAAEILSLPMYSELQADQIEYVAASIAEFYQQL